MDKTFWQGIVESDFKIPEGHSTADLTPETAALKGHVLEAVKAFGQ